ncbi:MAG: hypothetical protein V3T23_01825 [Nitrososphaerales archaeon]
MASKERVARVITSNVANFEELVSVKKSIYPWEDLVPQDDDDGDAPARNFLVAADDVDAARATMGSVRSSGLNYYLKRKINLVPVTSVVKLKNGSIGVLCVAIAPSSD